jgi:diadenosine tetraphosphatase ApaH/serine/threonine PP2A family protein phosphatase
MDVSLLFFGHTHRVGLYVEWGSSVREKIIEPGVAIELPRSGRYLVNPGSVGQPRDRDVRASYALFDTERWSLTYLRVPYDVEKAQMRILAAGLPEIHALRLAEGR